MWNSPMCLSPDLRPGDHRPRGGRRFHVHGRHRVVDPAHTERQLRALAIGVSRAALKACRTWRPSPNRACRAWTPFFGSRHWCRLVRRPPSFRSCMRTLPRCRPIPNTARRSNPRPGGAGPRSEHLGAFMERDYLKFARPDPEARAQARVAGTIPCPSSRSGRRCRWRSTPVRADKVHLIARIGPVGDQCR